MFPRQLAQAFCMSLLIVLMCPAAGRAQAVKATVHSNPLEPRTFREWSSDLRYDPADVDSLALGATGCPLIRASVAGIDLSLLLDTGTARGFVVTDHAGAVPYHDLGREEEANADGTHRGESHRIRVDSLRVLGKVFGDAAGTLSDWRMFSSAPFDGTVGLDFFLDRRVTLDYRALRVAVSTAPMPEHLNPRRYVTLDLVDPPPAQGHALYVRAKVNGRDALVYCDTGYNVSFIDSSFAADLPRVERPGRFRYFRQQVPVELASRTFVLDDLREDTIRRGDGFDLPVALILGSDVLSHFTVTVDLRVRKLILGAARQ